jgi:hypothetical protein
MSARSPPWLAILALAAMAALLLRPFDAAAQADEARYLST